MPIINILIFFFLSLYSVKTMATVFDNVIPYDKSKITAFKKNQNNKLFLSKKFKSIEDQISYSLGVGIGNYVSKILDKKFQISVERNIFISGIQDYFLNQTKLSKSEVTETIKQLENKIVFLNKLVKQKNFSDLDYKYRIESSKQEDVKEIKNKIFYKIKNIGYGNFPKKNDLLKINYIGYIVDGHEFDNSYKRKIPFIFKLQSSFPGWKESLIKIKKGGKIQIVIPFEKNCENLNFLNIPKNSTLIFDIELLDIFSSFQEIKF